MEPTRRELILTAAAAALGCTAGCATSPGAGEAPRYVDVDVGPAADYAADGIYDRYRPQGFFLVRRGGRLFALSSTCTHRACPLRKDGTEIACKCHGSTFDAAGHVTEGPATRDLPEYAVSVDGNGRLRVRAPARDGLNRNHADVQM